MSALEHAGRRLHKGLAEHRGGGSAERGFLQASPPQTLLKIRRRCTGAVRKGIIPLQMTLLAATVSQRHGHTRLDCDLLGKVLHTYAGTAQTTPCLRLDGQEESMTVALWLQVEQLNREIARAWEGLRQQPGGLHCVDMLVRKPLPLNSRPCLSPAGLLLSLLLQSTRASRQTPRLPHPHRDPKCDCL